MAVTGQDGENVINAFQAQSQRFETRLGQLGQRLAKVERNRRRETNSLEQDGGEHAAIRQNKVGMP